MQQPASSGRRACATPLTGSIPFSAEVRASITRRGLSTCRHKEGPLFGGPGGSYCRVELGVRSMMNICPNGRVFKERSSQVVPGGPTAAAAFLPVRAGWAWVREPPSVAGNSDTAATRAAARTLFFAYRLQNACTHKWRGCGHGQISSPCVCGLPAGDVRPRHIESLG